MGDAQHHFNYIEPSESGLFVKGEVRDIANIKTLDGSEDMVVAINNEKLCLFKKSKKGLLRQGIKSR